MFRSRIQQKILLEKLKIYQTRISAALNEVYRLLLIIATPYLLVFLSILLRGFKEFKIPQLDQYLEQSDLSIFYHSS